MPDALGGGEHVGELVFGRGQNRAHFRHVTALAGNPATWTRKPAQPAPVGAQVKNGATAFAGAGRGAGQDMPVMIKAPAAARRFGTSPSANASAGAAGRTARPKPRAAGGSSHGPRTSSTRNKTGHNSQASQPSGQPVAAWRRANGNQLKGRAATNSSERASTVDSEPVGQAAEADNHQDQCDSRDSDQGIGDGGEGAAGPRLDPL
jgi:hypothetical protein